MERFIEDGEADEKPTKVGVRFDGQCHRGEGDPMDPSARPRGKDAIVQALGLMAQADVATRKRVSRFYIDLAAENGISTEHAHAWESTSLGRRCLLVRHPTQPKAPRE